MDYIIKLAFVLLIFIYSWFFQIQNQEWDRERTLLKNANNLAVHDASLQIDEAERAHGHIIINPDAAYKTFQDTLQVNLGLDDRLYPNGNSKLHDSVKIVEFVILDESSGITFPYLYEDIANGITKYIKGPSIIAVIETKHPVLISRTKSQKPIRVPAIQELNTDD